MILDPASISGQAPVPENDRHKIIGQPEAHESAVLLFPDFGFDPEPNAYCRIIDIVAAKGQLAIEIEKTPRLLAHYELDAELQVAGVTPSIDLQTQMMNDSPPGALSQSGTTRSWSA